jgi:hypothetical protein
MLTDFSVLYMWQLGSHSYIPRTDSGPGQDLPDWDYYSCTLLAPRLDMFRNLVCWVSLPEDSYNQDLFPTAVKDNLLELGVVLLE